MGIELILGLGAKLLLLATVFGLLSYGTEKLWSRLASGRRPEAPIYHPPVQTPTAHRRSA